MTAANPARATPTPADGTVTRATVAGRTGSGRTGSGRTGSGHLRAGRSGSGESGAQRNGHTRVTKAALTHTTEAVVAEAFGVPRRDVKVSLADDDGALGITVSVPLPAPTFLAAARNPQSVRQGGGTFFERAETARSGIRETATRVTGSEVGRIDIRLTGIHPPAVRKLA